MEELTRALADADLDSLGRTDFFELSQALYQESLTMGVRITPVEWLRGQRQFLRAHAYFTMTSQRVREPIKQRNISKLEALIRDAGLTHPSK